MAYKTDNLPDFYKPEETFRFIGDGILYLSIDIYVHLVYLYVGLCMYVYTYRNPIKEM